MPMTIEPLSIQVVKLLRPHRFEDDRGYFVETYNKRGLLKHGIDLDFVQDNQSLSIPIGTVRGLHFQIAPNPVTKLVRVVKGSILDVAVDLRRNSVTFGEHVAVTLSAASGNQILIPGGFAHGFCTLESNTEVAYKVTGYWSPAFDAGVLWSDPGLGIDWPVDAGAATISAKDREWPKLADLPDEWLFG